MHRPLRVATHDAVVGDVGEVDIAAGVPGGTFRESHAALELEVTGGEVLGLGFRQNGDNEENRADEQSHVANL